MRVIVTKANAPKPATRPTGSSQEAVGEGPSGDSATTTTSDAYTDRVVALIPTEVTALFVALIAAVANAPHSTSRYAPTVLLVIGAVLTVLHLRRLGQACTPPVAPLRRQYVLSVLAFLAWGCSVADPLVAWDHEIPAWMLITAIATIPAVGAALFEKR